MKLIDTNVFINAWDEAMEFNAWAEKAIADAVRTDDACVSPVIVAELCAGVRAKKPEQILTDISSLGIEFADLPIGVAGLCGAAYRTYLDRRKAQTDKDGPRMPMPDFFIGAHAELMAYELVTLDKGRFDTYFPSVKRITPLSK